MIITYLAVASWCAFAYMLPVVAVMVWLRRRRDKTEIIQERDIVGPPECPEGYWSFTKDP